MEDKIKALIEKYDAKINKFKNPDMLKEYHEAFIDGRLIELQLTVSDLKQLLTTSQGNPECNNMV